MIGHLSFALLAANPVGGLLVAIPFAVLKLDYAPWVTVAVGLPLAYIQVFVIDLGWNQLEKLGWWRRILEKSRGKWADKLVASRGAFWVTFAATPPSSTPNEVLCADTAETDAPLRANVSALRANSIRACMITLRIGKGEHHGELRVACSESERCSHRFKLQLTCCASLRESR